MFSQEVDGRFVANGIPAWDFEFANLIDGPDESLGQVLADIQNAAFDSEGQEEVDQFWVDTVAEGITGTLNRLDESDTEELDLVGEIEEWGDDLIQYGIEQLTDDPSDPND